MSISALVTATTITGVLSNNDAPGKASALLIVMPRFWLLNEPPADSAAATGPIPTASISASRSVFMFS